MNTIEFKKNSDPRRTVNQVTWRSLVILTRVVISLEIELKESMGDQEVGKDIGNPKTNVSGRGE